MTGSARVHGAPHPTAARDPSAAGQLALVREGVRRAAPPRPALLPATELPVARVVVDVGLAHLDRPFDYLVPAELAADAVLGARVRVRFAGKDVAGFIVDRVDASDHVRALAPLRRVVSPEPVLSPELLRLARAVADRYAGTLSDVLRLAVPVRHARAEAAEPPTPASRAVGDPSRALANLERYAYGPEYLAALARGESPRAVWAALPGPLAGATPGWPAELAAAVRACVASERGAVIVVPDHRDVALVAAELDRAIGAEAYVALSADLGPERRYRRWLAALRGQVGVVVGTRAAAFAPVADLGLVVIWDDGDDLHAEPRAPYPHAREVLLLRAQQENAGLLVGGFAVTAEGAQLLRSGWARALRPPREQVRIAAARVRLVSTDDDLARDQAAAAARLPTIAWSTAREALERGPVLIQVPRGGYVPSLACARCREPARCQHCSGPLVIADAGGPPVCRWCGRTATAWQCPHCDGRRLRAPIVGARRTAEEIGRAFPAVPVVTSGGARVVPHVGSEPAIVVATTGAEPVAQGGYAAALLLDGWLLLARPELRAGEEALRRWMAAAALVRPAGDGGTVVLVAEPTAQAVQSLVRWDPFGHAERELADRRGAGLPPAIGMASVSGDGAAVHDFLAGLELPGGAAVLGPVVVPLIHAPTAETEQRRALIRVPRRGAAALSRALHAGLAARSARKAPGSLRVQVDPAELL